MAIGTIYRACCAIGICCLIHTPVVRAQQKPTQDRIYLALDDHTDYMWSGDEAGYRRAFLEMLDYYLDLADTTRDEPPEYQSRFNCDGSFWLWEYEHHKTAAEFERLIAQLKSAHLSAPMTALVSCYGGVPAEAVLRGMYYAGQLERRHGLRFSLAVAMENQTHPYGLASLWAGAGARYSWKGICGCSTKVDRPGERQHPIYWMTGPDGARILMKWYPSRDSQSLGGYAEARRPAEAIRRLRTEGWFKEAYPYRVWGLFGQGWDDFETRTDEFVRVAKQASSARQQVIVSNEEDFFRDFEAQYGDRLPATGASFGNEWDVLCVSLAEVSAQVKRSVEKLRAAEALATVVSLHQPDFMRAFDDPRDQAWMDLGLYWEHDWTADGPVSRQARADWQRKLANRIRDYVDTLHERALAALASLIAREGTQRRFVVFNPLGWKRTDVADIECPDDKPVRVVDPVTGAQPSVQRMIVAGRPVLRILAEDVPAVGYRVYELREGSPTNPAQPTIRGAAEGDLENRYYRLRFTGRGALESLYDKVRRQELARPHRGRWINDLGPAEGEITIEAQGPVCTVLLARSTAPLAHATRLTLFHDLPRIELANEIEQNFSDTLTWSFAFAQRHPSVHHEECGAILLAKLTSEGGHYSTRNARYDWLTLNHFANLTGDACVTLSNADCYFMRLGLSTTRRLDSATPALEVLAGGQVDGPSLGIPSQGGDTHFQQQFALQTQGAYDAAESMRFALEHQNRLVTGWLPTTAATGPTLEPLPLDASQYSLLALDNPRVLLWALKPAEEGIDQGVIVRLWNLADTPQEVVLAPGREFQQEIRAARRTTHLETDLDEAEFDEQGLHATLASQQLATFRLLARSHRTRAAAAENPDD